MTDLPLKRLHELQYASRMVRHRDPAAQDRSWVSCRQEVACMLSMLTQADALPIHMKHARVNSGLSYTNEKETHGIALLDIVIGQQWNCQVHSVPARYEPSPA